MKKLKLLIPITLIIAVIVTLLVAANVYATEVEGCYSYTVSGGGATITGVDSAISGDVVIPATLGGYPVTGIGESAFEDCTSITNITIPNSVKSIGNRAFYGCTGITEITIPASVTDIGTQVFYKASNLHTVYYNSSYNQGSSENNPFLNLSHIKKIVFGGSYVPRYIIKDNSFVEEIIIGNNVTSIGDHAFSGCSSLTEIEIPNSVKAIGDYAFENCSNLTSVNNSDSVTSIGDYAFYGCSSLASIEIPDSVTNIGRYAFYGCRSITSINIPSGVTEIDDFTFLGCGRLTSINIPDGVTSIGHYAFRGCSSLTSIEIPQSVTNIDGSAFRDCISLTSINIPSGITVIDKYTFSGCSSLTSIEIPKTVRIIGRYVFENCSSLTSIAIPDSVKNIGTYAFYGCSSLATVYYKGMQSDWNDLILMTDYNEPLTNANIIFATSDTPIYNISATPGEGGKVTGAGEYEQGTGVTLKATANEGYIFKGWYENGELVSESAIFTFIAEADHDFTAVFTDTAYTVTVNASPADYGTFIGGGTFAEGAKVRVTAIANTGYKFVGWYNGETKVSADAAYTFTAEANIALTAKFEKITYSIATDADGNLLNPYFINGDIWVEENGGIKMPANKLFSFLLFDTPLTTNKVEATFENVTFSGSGDDRNGIVFALTNHDGDTTLDGEGDAGVSYYWAFISGWEGRICVLKMGKYNNWGLLSAGGDWGKCGTPLAELGIDPANGVTLAVEWDNAGHIKVFANGILVEDITDTTGVPLTGNLYGTLVRRWSNRPESTNPETYTDILTSFVAYDASATKDENVIVIVDPTDAGTVTGAGKYEQGTGVTLKATANEGYIFKGWYENGELVSESAIFTFIAEVDRTLTAKFEKLQASVEVTASDEDIRCTINGNVVTVDYALACKVGYLSGDKYVALTATANGDGSYSYTVPEGVSSVAVVVSGDVNGDGVVNAGDYGRLNALLQGKISLTAEQDFAANTNGDATVNAGDYGRINAVLQGKTDLTW